MQNIHLLQVSGNLQGYGPWISWFSCRTVSLSICFIFFWPGWRRGGKSVVCLSHGNGLSRNTGSPASNKYTNGHLQDKDVYIELSRHIRLSFDRAEMQPDKTYFIQTHRPSSSPASYPRSANGLKWHH
jgi:hypothetical protein